MKQYKITYDRQGSELLIAHENNNCTFKIYRYENEYKNKMIVGKKENNLEEIGSELEQQGYIKIESEFKDFSLEEKISIANNLIK